jgi:N-acyl-D-aspartate/D-glutamate deacylase
MNNSGWMDSGLDMLIENGIIYDGDGNLLRKANIGIKDDKISFIRRERPNADTM